MSRVWVSPRPAAVASGGGRRRRRRGLPRASGRRYFRCTPGQTAATTNQGRWCRACDVAPGAVVSAAWSSSTLRSTSGSPRRFTSSRGVRCRFVSPRGSCSPSTASSAAAPGSPSSRGACQVTRTAGTRRRRRPRCRRSCCPPTAGFPGGSCPSPPGWAPTTPQTWRGARFGCPARCWSADNRCPPSGRCSGGSRARRRRARRPRRSPARSKTRGVRTAPGGCAARSRPGRRARDSGTGSPEVPPRTTTPPRRVRLRMGTLRSRR
mmetsp:Transcript_10991/g.47541  ORF Transcript_10991/g.47541 Transcript_10991/m.47541 type:complete len:265 (-) Transcript_10991:425-1219(-)